MSENYIKEKLAGNFDENSVLFAMTCQTLQSSKSGVPESANNLAKSFGSHGLCCYIGYDGPIDGSYAVIQCFSIFFNSIMNNTPINEEIDKIKDIPYEVESTKYKTYIHGIYRNKNIAVFSTVSDAEEVNLGFPVNFASCNLGADSPGKKEIIMMYTGKAII